MYDIIIVGARCAGAATARLLAAKGYRVLALDRSTFPSDRLSTHYIHPVGLAQLRRWGLLDRLIATGCPPITDALWWFGDVPVRGFSPPYDGIGVAYAPRRTVLDALLVEAAREAGAEVREGFSVRQLVFTGDRVTGVRGRAQGGPEQTLTAPVVVGADGRHSLVARQVQAAEYESRPALTVVYYTYWRGLDRRMNRNEVFIQEDAQIGLIPTHDDAILIQAARPHSWHEWYRADVDSHYHEVIAAAAPALARELSTRGERVDRFFGTAALENFYRTPYGPGWALVGDAGYHKDPLTGQGITDAWRDAGLLADALDAALSGREHEQTALAAYEQSRNAASRQLYDFTCQAATLDIDPVMEGIIRVLSGDRAQANRLFGVIAGTVPVDDFFSPDSMAALMQRMPAEYLASLESR
jgi:flavin-dependent dehydrogenase